MKRFSPQQFNFLTAHLKKAELALAAVQPTADITEDVDKIIRSLVAVVNEQRKTLEMLANQDEVNNRVSRLLLRINGYAEDIDGRSNQAVRHDLRVLRESLENGLGHRTFMYIPNDHAEFYDQSALFGERVAVRFPEAAEEITQAGNCYAIESYTACVFHLMRAVEITARAMVRSMKAEQFIGQFEYKNGVKTFKKKPIELCDWGTLRDGLRKALNELEKGAATNVRKKNKHAFFSHALAQFGYFKDAWRNKVSHTRAIYAAGTTKDIMDNTRHFMQHLASDKQE
jgi:hypothetical protein